MISVQEAQQAVCQHAHTVGKECIPLRKAFGSVLANNIVAPVDLPPFHQSAMDGYAVRYNDVRNDVPVRVIGESVAGKSFNGKVAKGEAVRIFTGAEVPQGADTVIMQEHVDVNAGVLSIGSDAIQQGANIRNKASHIAKKSLAVSKSTCITESVAGFIGSMGISQIDVFRKPAVTIIVTGSELQQPGTTLQPGKIFESNSLALQGALRACGVDTCTVLRVKDNIAATRRAVQNALESADIVLCTGGISVGDYDYVGTALQQERVRKVFYKVKQKPGKPLFFGVKGKKLVFGLPGNPASVLTCFYEYVYPALRISMGHDVPFLPTMQLPLVTPYSKKSGLTHFTKAVTDFTSVTILGGQESYIMRSYAQANCLAVIPEGTEHMQNGDIVTVHLLPTSFM